MIDAILVCLTVASFLLVVFVLIGLAADQSNVCLIHASGVLERGGREDEQT